MYSMITALFELSVYEPLKMGSEAPPVLKGMFGSPTPSQLACTEEVALPRIHNTAALKDDFIELCSAYTNDHRKRGAQLPRP